MGLRLFMSRVCYFFYFRPIDCRRPVRTRRLGDSESASDIASSDVRLGIWVSERSNIEFILVFYF